MPRKRTGSIRFRNGKFYARVSFTDAEGRQRFIERIAKNKTHAKQLVNTLLTSTTGLGNTGKRPCRTFKELADYYKEHYLIEAQYFEGYKVAGLREPHRYLWILKILTAYFGKQLIEFITYSDVMKFKLERYSTPVRRSNKQRSIATVNRDLSLLRRLFKIAQQEGWIKRNPCVSTTPLISTAAEAKRQRILSREEERRLLAQCDGHRKHLAPILICAIDTGMRRGEIFKLKWENVDLDGRLINIPRIITKTCNERQIGITDRLHNELLALRARTDAFKEGRVFGIKDNCSKSYDSVRRKAGLTDVRLHDLRHTAATRMVQGGLSIAEVARILGHAQVSTAYRYVNADTTTIIRSLEILNKFNQGT